MRLLERVVELERDVRYQDPPEEGEARVGLVRGELPVLLSAPHAAVHTRLGRSKEEEEFTAAIVCLVAELTGAHALYARRRSPTDPSWYPEVPYKGLLRQMSADEEVELVLDIHGMAPERNMGIALGTLKGRSCPDYRDGIVHPLEARGFHRAGVDLGHLDVDETFTGQGVREQETITSFVWRTLGVACAQLELHPALRVVERREDATLPRPYQGDPDAIRRVLGGLVDIVRNASSEGSTDG